MILVKLDAFIGLARLLDSLAASCLASQSNPAATLRSRNVQTAGNQKLIPIPHSRTSRFPDAERSTRHAARQSRFVAESQNPSATTACSSTEKRS